MKPDETPAPKHCPWHSRFMEGCTACQAATRTPVQPTESASIGGQAGEQISNEGGDEPCARQATMTRPSNAPNVVQSGIQGQAPSAGEVLTPRTDSHRQPPGTKSELLVSREFARQLERETVAFRKQVAGLEEALVIANRSADEQMRYKRDAEKQLAAEQAKVAEAQEHAENARILAREHLANSIRKNSVIADIEAQRDAANERAEKAESFANRVERGESSFKAAMNEQLKRISQLPTGKTVDESLADAVERCLTQLSTLRKAVEEIAELEGDCENQQFKLSRFQVSQIARAALNAEGGRS